MLFKSSFAVAILVIYRLCWSSFLHFQFLSNQATLEYSVKVIILWKIRGLFFSFVLPLGILYYCFL